MGIATELAGIGAYTVGLDLGRAQDFSACAVVERVRQVSPAPDRWSEPPRPVDVFDVVHLARWPLGTPYPSVADDVGAMFERPPLRHNALLVVDATGVGAAVTDMLADRYRDRRLRAVHPPVPVTITSGQQAVGWNFPKQDLVGTLQVALQQGRLRIADGLRLADQLERELVNFRQKITAAGGTTFDHGAGEGHGDLAVALMLALAVPNTLRPAREVDAPLPPMKESTDA